jgi:hypothetical protein
MVKSGTVRVRGKVKRMVEQEIEIRTNGAFKNIELKPKLHKGIKGLTSGNHIVVSKIYKDGMEKEGQYGKYYIAKVLYKDEEVSFFLNEKEHEAFSKAGNIGDKVKITLNKESFVNKKTGVESMLNKLTFMAA